MLAQPLAVDKSACAEFSPKALTNSVGMVFIYVPPGSFLMGSPSDEAGRDLDESQHEVTLTDGFFLQETEVTQAQWTAVMGDNPAMMKNPDCPATNISWDDALAFTQKLNQLEGTDAYRLPREAEWEWACRAGSPCVFPTGGALSRDQANYDGNHPYNGYEKGVFRRSIVKAGSFQPNPWGFYDMSGNVWEWCQDTYGPYANTSETDPFGPSRGPFKVIRGGSWYYDIQSCRCASRHKADPSKESILIGFRVAKSLQ
jgi:formylglycine-generating enzyme required for sulfatase activity